MTTATGDGLQPVWDALRGIYDPELCLDVVSMGLVYRLERLDDRVLIEMTLTTPGCPVSESLPQMARMAAEEALAGSLPVDLQVVWDPPWSPAMMSDDAARVLGFA